MPRPRTFARQERRGRTPVTTSAPEYAPRTLEIRRVSRMVAGGRRFRFRALVAVGNRKGMVGIGVGKGLDVARAIEKATRRARANLVNVPRRNGTIPREMSVKLGAAKILMRPARTGHGIVAGGAIRTICELAGITDISSKILSRSTNAVANAQAVIEAFRRLGERVAAAEGRKAKGSS